MPLPNPNPKEKKQEFLNRCMGDSVMNSEYEDSEKAAKKVSERINKVESIADALFEEWEGELKLYKSADLLRLSKRKLQNTKTRYREMLASMRRAEKSMEPV